ncbi:MAG: hypothetical protein NC935_08635 [Candidatus Omnitrophica bacterium]|nr:hypothetical protein [Candidatus Omnitrophota bacterium]
MVNVILEEIIKEKKFKPKKLIWKNLLKVFEEIGTELRDEIDKKIKTI